MPSFGEPTGMEEAQRRETELQLPKGCQQSLLRPPSERNVFAFSRDINADGTADGACNEAQGVERAVGNDVQSAVSPVGKRGHIGRLADFRLCFGLPYHARQYTAGGRYRNESDGRVGKGMPEYGQSKHRSQKCTANLTAQHGGGMQARITRTARCCSAVAVRIARGAGLSYRRARAKTVP